MKPASLTSKVEIEEARKRDFLASLPVELAKIES